jgi:hypothetical protein
MNLLEIQDKLNKLPPIPESVQYLTAAAQGGNPQVPPYMALARISEMNKEMQSAQQPQPPAEPLNQSLPKEAMQSMGIVGLAPQAAPQGMPPQAAPQGMPPQMQPPQGMPQQGMPQQGMPPQMQPPQGMAEGGLAGLPVDPRMFEYGSGGVVAFNGEDGDQEVEDDEADSGEESDATGANTSYDAVAELEKLRPQIAAQLKQQVRPIRDRAGIEKALTAKNDYGIKKGPIGEEYLQGLASLKEAKADERGKQEEDIARKEKLAAAKALIDWGEASRGQKGLGGIGAFGRSYIGATEKLMGERTALRESSIKTGELLNEAQYKIQELRRAQLKGDVAAEQKADTDLAKIAKDLNVSKNKLLSAQATGNFNILGKQIMADAQVASAKERAKGKGVGAKKPTDLGSSFEIELAALLAAGEPDDALTRKKAMNAAQDRLSRSAGTARADISRVEKANAEFSERLLFDKEARKLKSDPDKTKYKARAEEIRRQVEKEFGILPTTEVSTPAVPAAAPAAPTAGRITPEAFNAQWAKLKPDQKLVGPDGVTYTKK